MTRWGVAIAAAALACSSLPDPVYTISQSDLTALAELSGRFFCASGAWPADPDELRSFALWTLAGERRTYNWRALEGSRFRKRGDGGLSVLLGSSVVRAYIRPASAWASLEVPEPVCGGGVPITPGSQRAGERSPVGIRGTL